MRRGAGGSGPARRAAVAALGALALSGCGEREDPEARASLEEATITAEVRSRLLVAGDLQELPLTVRASGGTVTIAGVVRDSTQPDEIRAIAERVGGVSRVDLALRVEPLPPDSAAADSAARGAAGAAPSGPRPAREGERRAPPDTLPLPGDSLPSVEEAG